LATCVSWITLSITALAEEGASPCADGVFAEIVNGGGGGLAMRVEDVLEAVLFVVCPMSKFPENPSAIPSIHTAARA
jgi:hypothetical protein